MLALGCGDLQVGPDIAIDGGIQLPGGSDDGERDGSGDDDGDDGATGDGGGNGPATTGEPSDDDGPGSGPPSCGGQSVQLSIHPPQVVLLLDKSGSMVQNLWDHDRDPGTQQVTRWNSLFHVVETTVHDVEDGVDLGMVLFPSVELEDEDSATACIVDPLPQAAVAPANADTLVDALPGPDATDLFGGTPVSGGLAVVLEHLAEIEDGRTQAVVLVTDGAANCMTGTEGAAVFTEYDENLRPMVADAHAAGVSTYVVGVDIEDELGFYPVANPYERLNELALAGGVPREGQESFYNAVDEAQLTAALGAIGAQLGCTITLDTPAEYSTQVRVMVGGEEIPQVLECQGGDGWRYGQDHAPYTSIELCETACAEAHGEAQIDLDYACVPEG